MFTPLLFMLLPFVFLIHDAEEIAMRKNWMDRNADMVMLRFPWTKLMLSHLRTQSTRGFCLIVSEEFLLIVLGVACMIYVSSLPIAALMWGFILHLFVHIAQAILLRSYVPGLTTSIVLLPYAVLSARVLTLEFSAFTNLLLAVIGIFIVALNLVVMHRIFK